MAKNSKRYDDPELNEMESIGVIERQHRRAARALGISHTSLGVVWLLVAAIAIGVVIALWA